MINPTIRRILDPYRARILWVCAFTVVQAILQVAFALVSRGVIDSALRAQTQLWQWIWLLVADILAIVVIHGVCTWLAGSTMDYLAASMRQAVLRSAVYSRDGQLTGHHSGALLNRAMEDVRVICDGAVNALPGMVGQVTRLVTAFAVVVMIWPAVAVVMLIAAVVTLLLTACLRPILKKRQRTVRQSDEQLMSLMQEDLQQLELIHSLDAQEQTLKRFLQRTRENLLERFHRRIWSVGSNAVMHAALQFASGGMLIWGAIQIAAGTLSYGSLTALLQLVAQFRAPVLGLSGIWARLAAVEVASERLAVLLQPVEQPEQLSRQVNVTQIVFENVTFAYPGEEAPVLQNFSYTIPVTGWTCLTGISGKGKTTMFKLILGLYQPQEGRIYLQTDDAQLDCGAQTRSLFAYVPQDYALFSGTVLENMQLIKPDITRQQLEQALNVAQADFVWDMQQREHTPVRENNAGMSKGQLQRLAIARATLMDRPIFLLDECTSALDAQTEDAVLRGLKALGKQAILVTHRPEAVEALGQITCISMEQ